MHLQRRQNAVTDAYPVASLDCRFSLLRKRLRAAVIHMDRDFVNFARPAATFFQLMADIRAACSTGVPTGKRPRRPEGVNTTKGSF